MTPLLGTTGGGSGRGFGRGFKPAAVAAGPSAAPSNLSATPAYAGSSNTAQMSLSWTNGDATSQTEVYNGASLVTTVNAGVATYTVASLNASTSYSFTVKHIKNSVRSNASNTATNTTYDYNGHYVSNYCAGTNNYDLYYTYADGNGGTYNSLYESNSATCVPVYNISATGGTTSDSGGWRTHEFTSTGTFTVSSCDAGAVIQVILAAGGGGSAWVYYQHVGGGAGGGSLEYDVAKGISATNYSIVIGAGGAAANGVYSAYKGGNTTGFGITAYGGGYGAAVSTVSATSGGSGGGGVGYNDSYGAAGNGSNVYDGGLSGDDRRGGGGGGAGGAGGNGGGPSRNSQYGGSGGSALTIGFSPYALCGGGGGGSGWIQDCWYGGTGGSGAGNGGYHSYDYDGLNPDCDGEWSCTNGTANRGGGAGGGGYYVNSCSGGSGIVLIRYRI